MSLVVECAEKALLCGSSRVQSLLVSEEPGVGAAMMEEEEKKKHPQLPLPLPPSPLQVSFGMGVGVGLGLGVVDDSTLTTLDPTLLLPRTRSAKDLRVPMPWGYLAGKDWGGSRKESKTVLCIHGWQDNCGSFDLVVTHLPPRWRLVAVDLPGHGFSSPFPRGALHHHLDFLAALKRAVCHLGWQRFTLMGHGFGAELAVCYADFFPSEVEQLILLELDTSFGDAAMDQSQRLLHLLVAERQCVKKTSVGQLFVQHLQLDEHGQSEVMESYQVAVDRLVQSRKGQLSPWAAQVLLKRGLRLSSNGRGYVDARAALLKAMPKPSPLVAPGDSAEALLRRLGCPVLLIRATEEDSSRRSHSSGDQEKPRSPGTSSFLERSSSRGCGENGSSLSCLWVKGTPFALLNCPAQMGAAIASFLERHNCRL